MIIGYTDPFTVDQIRFLSDKDPKLQPLFQYLADVISNENFVSQAHLDHISQ
jgi:hypothetical protein